MEVREARSVIEQLEMQCANKMPVADIVKAMLEQLPLQVAASIPMMIDVNKLIETIRNTPVTAKMTLATGKGRRFVQDLWNELKKQTDALSAMQPGGDEGAADAEEAGE